MIQTIVFDFGNVIGFFDHRRATDFLATHSDLTSEAILATMVGGALEDDYESGRISSDEYLRHVRKVCQIRCADEVAAKAYADIFWPNEDVCTLIPRLRPRYRLLLGSNTTELHALQFKRQFADLFRHFDHLVLSFEIGVRKPRSGFFEHCQGLAGCAPSECLFIDDLVANVEGARACGWQGIVYRGIDDLRANLDRLNIQM
jgi:putative hydrolase of the HAD superfamily